MRMKMAPKRNSQPDQLILSGGANQNSPGGLVSSSVEQATSGHLPPPVLENFDSDTSDDEFVKPNVENKANKHDGNVVVAQDSASNNPRKRKRNHRHTQHQINFMENFFRKVSRPNKSQRQDIADELGLDHLQVKFWFQNRRTQMKAQEERYTNDKLRAENEKLRLENMRLKQKGFVNYCTCSNSDFMEMSPEERMLRLENIQLNKEMERVMAIAKNAVVNQSMPLPLPLPPPSAQFVTPTPLLVEFGKSPSRPTAVRSVNNDSIVPNVSQVAQLAVSAMEEVVAMATLGEPLWLLQPSGDSLLLNEPEYSRIFGGGFSTKLQGFRTEATRESTIIVMEAATVVDMLMDLGKWLTMFTSVISKGMILEILSPGVAENYDGAMQVMFAEFQALSPVVPTRDCIFVRYSKRLNEEIWQVLDVSIDTLLPNGGPITKCQKRPSGCIIQELPNGCSKITWVEHVEVKDETIHNLAKSIISSGNAYGARRWISILERQCERITSATVQTNWSHCCHLNEIALGSPVGRQNILKLAEKMVLKFYGGVSAPYTDYPWTIISGNGYEQVRIMINTMVPDHVHGVDDLAVGRPGDGGSSSRGGGRIVLCASSCFWMPILPKDVFTFLRNQRTRNEWDALINGGGVQEIARIDNGTEAGNCVSVLRVLSSQANQGNMLILQESSSEATSSFLVYAPVDPVSFRKLFDCGNPEELQFLPSGFSILPSGPPPGLNYVCRGRSGGGGRANAVVNGTLLTVAFQVEIESGPYARFSAAATTMVTNLVETTVYKIKAALGVDC